MLTNFETILSLIIIILPTISTIAYKIALWITGLGYRGGLITTKEDGSVAHWTIRLFITKFCLAIILICIFLILLINPSGFFITMEQTFIFLGIVNAFFAIVTFIFDYVRQHIKLKEARQKNQRRKSKG